MKHFLFMIVMTMGLSFKALTEPFWAVALYYMWGVLRPQAIWDWALRDYPDMRWSLIAALVALVMLVIRSGGLGKPKVEPGFVSLVFMFGMCVLFSYISAYNMDEAATPSWEYSKIIIMLMVAALVVTEPRYIRYLGWIVFGGLIYIVYTVNSLYVFDGRVDIIEGYAGLDNNGAALMMAMVVPFCYYFFMAEHRWWRWGYLFCMIAAAHAVMLTNSRGAMLSSLLAFVGMVMTTEKTKRWRMIVIAVALALMVMPLAGKQVRARFGSSFDEGKRDEDASVQSRYGSWEAGMKIVRDYPIFGVGPRNSKFFIKDYGADFEGRTIHNLYIQLAADCGFPAVTFYMVLYFSSMIWAWKGAVMVKNHTTHEQRWHYNISMACFWSLALFLVGAFFLSLETFETPYLLMFIGATSQRFSLGMREVPETELMEAVPEAEAMA